MLSQSQSVARLCHGTLQLLKTLPTSGPVVRFSAATKLNIISNIPLLHQVNWLLKTAPYRSLPTCPAFRPLQSSNQSFNWNNNQLLHSVRKGFSIPLVQSIRNTSVGSKGNITQVDSKSALLSAKKKGQAKKKRAQADSEVGGAGTSPGSARGASHGIAAEEVLLQQQHDFLTFDPGLELPHPHQHRPRRPDREVIAYATADEYDLEAMNKGFKELGLYVRSSHHVPGTAHMSSHTDSRADLEGFDPSIDGGKGVKGYSHSSSQANEVLDVIPDISEVLHVLGQYKITPEERQIYFFRDGAVVFWNVSELERINVLTYISRYTLGTTVSRATVEEQSESFPYLYSEGKTRLANDCILLSDSGPTHLERYTFSNALALSVKLGVWESELEYYIDSIENVTEEMKSGRVILKNKEVLAHLGQLYNLRHSLKMSSGLLETPDYYWERKNLEQLYERTTTNLSINRRMQVMSDKLNNCLEMMSVLKDYHAVVHGHRLEVIIIVLIVVEVIFEAAHFLSKEGDKGHRNVTDRKTGAVIAV